MTVVATALHGVTSSGGRVAPGLRRRIARGVALGLGALAAAGALAASATMVAAWMVSGVLSGNFNNHASAPFGPRTLALADHRPPPRRVADEPVRVAVAPADAAETSFETKWARAAVDAPVNAPLPLPRAKPRTAQIKVAALNPAIDPATVSPKPIRAVAENVPLPRPRPATHEMARTPTPARAPPSQVASAGPPETTGSIPRDPPQPVHDKVTLPTPGSRIAVYDISAHTVYLPNGEKLEAHSGLGDKMDDPRHVHVRMRGATPPNVYDLRMRESLFHGVPAIRLKPVNDDKMFGRDGILAHTYMLGPNGQSNGCVSFKNYAAFLRAFQKGDIDRLVVVAKLGDTVPNLDTTPLRTVRAPTARRWRVADSSRATVSKQASSTGQW